MWLIEKKPNAPEKCLVTLRGADQTLKNIVLNHNTRKNTELIEDSFANSIIQQILQYCKVHLHFGCHLVLQ